MDGLARVVGKAEDDPRVLAVIVFGSEARGEAAPRSDVDVCLVLSGDHDASRVRLEYLAEADLDLHVFRQLPLPIRRRVLREGRVEHVKDEDALYAVALRTVKEWEDFRPRYEMYLESIGER